MEKVTMEQIRRLSIQEMVILPIETLLELEMEAEGKILAARKLHSWINGAMAIKNLRNEKAKNGGQL